MTPTDPIFANDLGDFFGASSGDDPFDRPERTEDYVPRDSYDKPRILPVGKKMPNSITARDSTLRSYSRPSSMGKVIENTFMLERWQERQVAEGFTQSSLLRLEWSASDPDDREKRDKLVREAKKLARAEDKARAGTAVHALTERHDLGLPLKNIPEEYAGDVPAWVKVMQNFKVLDVECFVVEDIHKGAGTFDRLIYYHVPCPICGKHNRILDLKTGNTDWGHIAMAVQLAEYAHGSYYNPATGERTALPDVCLCRAIIVNLPAGTGKATLHWINIAQGWELALEAIAKVKEVQRKRNWMAEFTTLPDIIPEIMAAKDQDDLNRIWREHKSMWLPMHTKAGELRLAALAAEREGI